MRTHPIGTGPFKFVEFKQNESIKLAKNANYWKKGLPYLDGIELTIISNRATAVLAFVAGKVDMTFPTEMTKALIARHQDAGPDGDLRDRPDQRQHQPDRQSRERRPSTTWSCARRWRSRSIARRSSTSSTRVHGRRRRHAAAAARRRLGHAARNAQDDSGLWPDVKKDREQARAIMDQAWLRAEQAAQDQGIDTQSRHLSRPRGGADRPAQDHLYRRRARPG